MWESIRQFVAKLFQLYTVQTVAPQPIVFDLNKAERIVEELRNRGHSPQNGILSSIRIASGVLGVLDIFETEVSEARQYAEEEAAESRASAESYRQQAQRLDAKAARHTARAAELEQLKGLFA